MKRAGLSAGRPVACRSAGLIPARRALGADVSGTRVRRAASCLGVFGEVQFRGGHLIMVNEKLDTMGYESVGGYDVTVRNQVQAVELRCLARTPHVRWETGALVRLASAIS